MPRDFASRCPTGLCHRGGVGCFLALCVMECDRFEFELENGFGFERCCDWPTDRVTVFFHKHDVWVGREKVGEVGCDG